MIGVWQVVHRCLVGVDELEGCVLVACVQMRCATTVRQGIKSLVQHGMVVGYVLCKPIRVSFL